LGNVLDYVIAADRTPRYKADEPNVRGDKPAAGEFWPTPREYAEELLRHLEPIRPASLKVRK
jgi:hypothetical protein